MGRIPPQGVMGTQNYAQVSNSRDPINSGTEAVAPIEVGVKSPRIKFASAELNEEVLRLNLDLLEEKHERALKRVKDYHRKTARYYDRRVRPRSYKVRRPGSKKTYAKKERPHTWEAGTQLGRALYRIPHSPTWQVQIPNIRRKNPAPLMEC